MNTQRATARCPICLSELNTLHAASVGLWMTCESLPVYFCSWQHREQFEDEPKAFMLVIESNDDEFPLRQRDDEGDDEAETACGGSSAATPTRW